MTTSRLPVIVLAGGKSTRLGRDKASEVLAGKSLLQRAVDACAAVASRYVVVSARGQVLPAVDTGAIPTTVIEDAYPETGPLGGICTGLELLFPPREGAGAGPEDGRALVVACDMPLLQPALLSKLVRLAPGHDAVAPVHSGGLEPLCAVYAASCIPIARDHLARGDYRTTALLEAIATLRVPEQQWRPLDPDARSFLNVNREADLQQARRVLDDLSPDQ